MALRSGERPRSNRAAWPTIVPADDDIAFVGAARRGRLRRPPDGAGDRRSSFTLPEIFASIGDVVEELLENESKFSIAYAFDNE